MLLAVWLAFVSLARAADLDQLDTSLKLIPADAAYYSTMLRNKEQIELIANSRAWAKTKALPFVQLGLQKLEQEWKAGELSQVRGFFEEPDNRQLLDLLGDMASHEIFLYGGKNSVQFAELVGELFAAYQFAPLKLLAQGDFGALTRPEARLQPVLDILTERPDRIGFPDIVIGFKLTDTRRAEAQLDRLEKLLGQAAEEFPPLEGRTKRQKIGRGDFLVLGLDGGMVPWDLVPFNQIENQPGQFDKLVKRLREVKLTVCVGVRDGYLLFSLGESTAPIEALGKGPRLVDRPELKRLARFADQKVSGISYTSQELHALSTGSVRSLEGMAQWATEFIEQASLPGEVKARIKKDIAALTNDLKPYWPEPGATAEVNLLTDRGSESYSYDWTRYPSPDASKPLTLLNHVGGSPLLAVVSRSKTSPKDYQLLVKWLKVGHQYAEELVLPMLGEDVKTQYDQVMKQMVRPFLTRVDKATGTMLVPALADGQAAFVLDAGLTSKQWHQAMPQADKPLPMLEPAIVLGVSDAALLKQAVQEYREAINDLVASLGGLVPIPPVSIPEPDSSKVSGGTAYFYRLPELLGLDPRLMPTAGLSERVATLAISQEHTGRLLAATPLKVDSQPLANTKRPLSSAVYFDWAGLVDATGPWVDYALRLSSVDESVRDQVQAVLPILRCFRGYSSCTYLEEGVTVTHGEAIFRDIEN